MGIDWVAELDKLEVVPDEELEKAKRVVAELMDSENEVVRVLAAMTVLLERATRMSGSSVVIDREALRR